MRTVMLAAAFAALAATTAQAQVQAKRFSVTTRVGTVTPERSSSLDIAGLVGRDDPSGYGHARALVQS
jgi:outer membrane protein W